MTHTNQIFYELYKLQILLIENEIIISRKYLTKNKNHKLKNGHEACNSAF